MSATANIDLRKSTFLDLTSDSRVIEQVLGASDDLAKQSFFDSLDETNRAFTFAVYAEAVGDDALLSKVNTEFESELAALFNE